MSEIPLDELVKQKYEAQLKLQALQYEERLNSLRKTSRDLENMTSKRKVNLKLYIIEIHCYFRNT